MNLKDIGSKIGFQIKKHTPEILTGTAIASGVAAFVIGIIKAEDVKKKIEDHKTRMQELHKDIDEMGEDLHPAERRRLVAAEYGKTAWEVTKSIGPAAALEALSIGTIIGLYREDKKDKLDKAILSSALSASYATIETLRKRIAEKYGDEAEKDIYLGREEQEIEEVIVDEKGKEKVKKKKVTTYSPADPYAITWGYIWGVDENGKEYPIPTSVDVPRFESNKLKYDFLIGRLREANDRLIAKRRVSLAEVYDLIGYDGYLKSKETIKMATRVGWVLADNPEDQVGDPYIRFGIDKDDKQTRDFTSERIDALILTFNCTGDIFSEIPKQKQYTDMFNYLR